MTPAYFASTESLTFSPGQLIVVSGDDAAAVMTLLLDARDAIRLAGTPCLDPVDTRMTIPYPTGLVGTDFTPTTTRFRASLFRNTVFEVIGTTITMLGGVNAGLSRVVSIYEPENDLVTFSVPFPVPPAVQDPFSVLPIVEKAFNFEFLVVTHRASGPSPMVVLVGNQFNRLDPKENPFPANIAIDVVKDLLTSTNVNTVPEAASSLWGSSFRELFSYISKVYYYDSIGQIVTFVKDQIPDR